jgi:hypothetical protein
MHNLTNSQSSHEFLTSTNNVSNINNLTYLRTHIQLQNYIGSNADIVVKSNWERCRGMLSRCVLGVKHTMKGFREDRQPLHWHTLTPRTRSKIGVLNCCYLIIQTNLPTGCIATWLNVKGGGGGPGNCGSICGKWRGLTPKRPERLWNPFNPLLMGTGSPNSELKRPGWWTDHSVPSSSAVKDWLELHAYPSILLHGVHRDNFIFCTKKSKLIVEHNWILAVTECQMHCRLQP